MKKILLKAFMLVMLMCVSMGAWAEVVSGTTYSTPSKDNMPSGWTCSVGGGTTYVQLTASTHYILTDEFTQGGITSIKIKARKYGGPTDAQAKITASWVGSTTQELGSVTPSSTTLADYTISSINQSITGTGKVKIECKGASSSKGSGVSQVTITYKSGAVNTYTITFASNAQGTFSAKVDGNTVTSGSKVGAGKTVTLTAEPNDGYVFNSWNVYKTANQYDYVAVSESNTFTMPSEAVTVDAYFVEGKTIPNAQVSLAAGTYRGEQSVTITNLDEDEYSYYYTLDGSTPEIDGNMDVVGTTLEYNGAISITESCTLSILTTDLSDSKINTFEYVIEYPYTVTIVAPENGTLTVMNGETPVQSGEKFYKGDVITATATPADGYKFRNLQVVDATTHTYTSSNVKEWTMGDHEITISANFDEIQYYTINYMVNGVNTDAQKNVVEGTALVFPTPAAIYGKQFMGWAETEIDGTTNTAPSFVNIEGLTATANKTYYAVFANVEENPENWNKVTDASSLEENDVIAIVSSEAVDYNIKGNTTKYNGYIAMGKTQNTNTRAGEVVTVADGVMAINNNVQQITLTKATIGGNTDWQLVVDGGFLYVNSSSNNNLKTQETNNVNGLWNISISDGKATIYAKYSSYTRNYIRVNGNYQNSTTVAPVVTAYASTATTGVLASIYKKEGGNIYSDYCTTVSSSADITISAAGYSTLYLGYAVTIPDGVQAFTGVLVGNKLTMTELPDGKIPAETAVVLKATAANYKFEATTCAPFSGSNDLKGCLTATTTSTIGGGTVCTLAKEDGVVGFYKFTGPTLGANKAYLVVAPETPARVTMSFEDEESAIETVEVEKQNNDMFDLMGRRTNNKTGLRIVNGKKVMLME